MFCFQCQETVGGKGCERAGVCGKSSAVADAQDRLIATLKEIALTREPSIELGRFVASALFTTITNANFDEKVLNALNAKASALVPRAKLEKPASIGVLAEMNEDVRSLKELLIYGLKGICAYAEHAAALGYDDESIYEFLFKALAATTRETTVDAMLPIVLECGAVAVSAMQLLDKANTETYGAPQITKVKLGVGTRPGILLSGHDLRDFQELLEQSKDAGVDVYTHSEGLPAHYYPKLKAYPHLYGNYGGAWYAQQKEFASFNGAILMTTNCLTPVRDEYKDRIFTTGPVRYPGVEHIADRPEGGVKDFSAVIKRAKSCQPPTPLEEGELVGGFAHEQVFALADAVVDAIKSGQIKRFVVMAGCDGRQKARDYYAELAKKLPKDWVILTAGCAKYRYNKLNLGEIEGTGIPRVLDAGQCNDSYSLALTAFKLKEAFALKDINDLPLSFAIGWYEQKAVAVLLALLHLGFKNVRLGPTLPAFLSPNVLKVLIENFNIMLTSDPESDLTAMKSGL